MLQNKFNLKTVLAAGALLLAGYTQAQVSLPSVTTGTTHCITTQDDCTLNPGAKVSVTFTITVGQLVQFTNGDFRARVELYRGDWTSQGLAGHIVSNEVIYPTPKLSPTRTVADITTYNFSTLSFFTTGAVFNVTKNGTYRAKTYLQQYVSGEWTTVFTTPLSPIYGANDQPPFNSWGDMGEVAFVQNLKIGTDFNHSVNGLYQSAPAPLTVATCASAPLTIKNVTGTMGNPGSATLTIEKGTLSGNVFTASTSTTTTFNAESANDINLTSSPFSLGSYVGALRITYRLPDDVCNSVATSVVKTTTLSVVTAAFLNDYKASAPATTGSYVCPNTNTSKVPAATVAEIVSTMPSNTTLNNFKCELRSNKGWQGATSVGIKDVTFTGAYSVDVYEVNSSGVRLSGAPSIYLNSGQILPGQESSVDLRFNDAANGAEFDVNAPYYVSTTVPADITGNSSGVGNYFYNYYLWAKANSGLATMSARIFCVEVNQYPAGGCVVSKKSFFKIANNGYGATANGQNARFGSPDEETAELPEYMSLDVFPNPTTGELNIPITADDKDVNITIMDNLGKHVLTLNNVQNGKINIEKLTSGIYFYTIQKNGEVYRGKVVKE